MSSASGRALHPDAQDGVPPASAPPIFRFLAAMSESLAHKNQFAVSLHEYADALLAYKQGQVSAATRSQLSTSEGLAPIIFQDSQFDAQLSVLCLQALLGTLRECVTVAAFRVCRCDRATCSSSDCLIAVAQAFVWCGGIDYMLPALLRSNESAVHAACFQLVALLPQLQAQVDNALSAGACVRASASLGAAVQLVSEAFGAFLDDPSPLVGASPCVSHCALAVIPTDGIAHSTPLPPPLPPSSNHILGMVFSSPPPPPPSLLPPPPPPPPQHQLDDTKRPSLPPLTMTTLSMSGASATSRPTVPSQYKSSFRALSSSDRSARAPSAPVLSWRTAQVAFAEWFSYFARHHTPLPESVLQLCLFYLCHSLVTPPPRDVCACELGILSISGRWELALPLPLVAPPALPVLKSHSATLNVAVTATAAAESKQIVNSDVLVCLLKSMPHLRIDVVRRILERLNLFLLECDSNADIVLAIPMWQFRLLPLLTQGALRLMPTIGEHADEEKAVFRLCINFLVAVLHTSFCEHSSARFDAELTDVVAVLRHQFGWNRNTLVLVRLLLHSLLTRALSQLGKFKSVTTQMWPNLFVLLAACDAFVLHTALQNRVRQRCAAELSITDTDARLGLHLDEKELCTDLALVDKCVATLSALLDGDRMADVHVARLKAARAEGALDALTYQAVRRACQRVAAVVPVELAYWQSVRDLMHITERLSNPAHDALDQPRGGELSVFERLRAPCVLVCTVHAAREPLVRAIFVGERDHCTAPSAAVAANGGRDRDSAGAGVERPDSDPVATAAARVPSVALLSAATRGSLWLDSAPASPASSAIASSSPSSLSPSPRASSVDSGDADGGTIRRRPSRSDSASASAQAAAVSSAVVDAHPLNAFMQRRAQRRRLRLQRARASRRSSVEAAVVRSAFVFRRVSKKQRTFSISGRGRDDSGGDASDSHSSAMVSPSSSVSSKASGVAVARMRTNSSASTAAGASASTKAVLSAPSPRALAFLAAARRDVAVVAAATATDSRTSSFWSRLGFGTSAADESGAALARCVDLQLTVLHQRKSEVADERHTLRSAAILVARRILRRQDSLLPVAQPSSAAGTVTRAASVVAASAPAATAVSAAPTRSGVSTAAAPARRLSSCGTGESEAATAFFARHLNSASPQPRVILPSAEQAAATFSVSDAVARRQYARSISRGTGDAAATSADGTLGSSSSVSIPPSAAAAAAYKPATLQSPPPLRFGTYRQRAAHARTLTRDLLATLAAENLASFCVPCMPATSPPPPPPPQQQQQQQQMPLQQLARVRKLLSPSSARQAPVAVPPVPSPSSAHACDHVVSDVVPLHIAPPAHSVGALRAHFNSFPPREASARAHEEHNMLSVGDSMRGSRVACLRDRLEQRLTATFDPALMRAQSLAVSARKLFANAPPSGAPMASAPTTASSVSSKRTSEAHMSTWTATIEAAARTAPHSASSARELERAAVAAAAIVAAAAHGSSNESIAHLIISSPTHRRRASSFY